MADRQIVAIGGWPWGEDAAVRALQGFVLGLARGTRVGFVPTAGGDDPSAIVEFYERWRGLGELTHLGFFPWPDDDLRGLALGQDVLVVGGGNTANMLAIWRLHGVEDALRKAHANGTILTGWSAGCICWFEAGITDSFTPELGPLRDGLKLLAGSACPHYDSEERRRPVYQREVANGLLAGIALEDAVAARYDDERLVEIVTARPGGRAFRVDRTGERALDVRTIG